MPEAHAAGSGPGSPVVLVVDGDAINRRLLRAILRTVRCRYVEVDAPHQALEWLQSQTADLIIIDLVMPGMGAQEFCTRVRALRQARLTQILVLSSTRSLEKEVEVLATGADGFIAQPVHPEALRARLMALLRHKALLDTLEEAEGILFSLAQAVEARDRSSIGHCERLALYSVALGAALGLSEVDLLTLHRGAFLHDIGKVWVPDAILFKPGPLDSAEWDIMRQHPIKGEEICRPMRTLAPVLPIIRHHHERWDGSGYPDGLAGEQIPLLARVLQISDIFDALTTERPYKNGMAAEVALTVLQEEAEKGWRDPELVNLFRDVYHRLNSTELSTWPQGPTEACFWQSLEALSRQLNL